MCQRLKTPLKTGSCLKGLDSGFRRNDGKRYFPIFYEIIILNGLIFPVIYDPSTILISSSVNSYNS